LIKIRFETPHDDYRPVNWSPPYPFWKTGISSNDDPIIVAYLDSNEQLYEYWPDAKNVSSVEEVDEINFTDRFQKPDWWEDEKKDRVIKTLEMVIETIEDADSVELHNSDISINNGMEEITDPPERKTVPTGHRDLLLNLDLDLYSEDWDYFSSGSDSNGQNK
jgi:hypothetical protein